MLYDMQTPVNCIEKNRVFSVEKSRDGNIFFTVDDAVYRMDNARKIQRLKGE